MTIFILLAVVLAMRTLIRVIDPLDIVNGGIGYVSIPVVAGGVGVAADLILWAVPMGFKAPVAIIGVTLTWGAMGYVAMLLVVRLQDVDPKLASQRFGRKRA